MEGVDPTKLDNPIYVIGVLAVCILVVLQLVKTVFDERRHRAMMNGGNPVTQALHDLVNVTREEHAKTRQSMVDTAAETAKCLRGHNGECDDRWKEVRRSLREMEGK